MGVLAFSPRCMVCGAKNTGRPCVVLPDVQRGVLVRSYLCVRHSLPQHIQPMITNTIDLVRALSSSHPSAVGGALQAMVAASGGAIGGPGGRDATNAPSARKKRVKKVGRMAD
jgi:hypothetical protein